MIAVMRTKAQAQKVADLTGGQVISNGAKPTIKGALPGDFEKYRSSVESVSVLFQLCDDAGKSVPSGWTLIGATFEVEWPKDPQVASGIRSHFDTRHFAYNWALAKVKSDMDAKKENSDHKSIPWTLEALRKEWNQEKNEIAPWSGDNSKGAYSSGIADLVQALSNWSQSKRGQRKGKRVGFPKFASKRTDPGRVRFTTGAMRFEDDRRTIVLPTIGGLRSKLKLNPPSNKTRLLPR